MGGCWEGEELVGDRATGSFISFRVHADLVRAHQLTLPQLTDYVLAIAVIKRSRRALGMQIVCRGSVAVSDRCGC